MKFFLGITDRDAKEARSVLMKKNNAILTFFSVFLLLPAILLLLFYFDILKSKPVFADEIQEPVAKVITKYGTGTAFLVSPTRLLTARHVVEKYQVGETVDIVFEKAKALKQVKAKIAYIAPGNFSVADGNKVPLEYFLTDFALLEVDEIDDIIPFEIGSSASVMQLDEVILIGYPNNDYSITKGNINSLTYQGLDLFKFDAATNPGNSGGPLILKADNTVVGIIVGGPGMEAQGENVAVKIDNVRKLIKF
jgi:V8-like Glu-specific endopeptidase